LEVRHPEAGIALPFGRHWQWVQASVGHRTWGTTLLAILLLPRMIRKKFHQVPLLYWPFCCSSGVKKIEFLEILRALSLYGTQRIVFYSMWWCRIWFKVL
jgi:hypothetical protein